MTNRRWTRVAAVFLLALLAAASSPARAQEEAPFRVVVLGDSIMWGQGLPEADKFTTQVREWLARQLHGVVDARLTEEDGHLTLVTRRLPEVFAWLRERWDAAAG